MKIKENVEKRKNNIKFMAMSKLIGLVAFSFVFIITLYSMIEMHITQDYNALPQLIISAFSFAGVYAGFYLTMAKVEHIEYEKTKREKELISLKKQQASDEDILDKKQEIEELRHKINEIISEGNQNLI